MNREDYIVPTGQLHSFEYKPCYDIKFHRDGKTIGTLDFNGPALVFTGDAEEGAKVFMDWLAELFMGRLEQERAAEREACAKVCEERTDPLGYANLTAEACAAAIRARGEMK
jgi:hypothetical protein